MLEGEQFPFKTLYDALCNTAQLEKNFKYFINEFQEHNMNWIYETIATFQKILSNPKQMPILKFNTLLAIKYCFDTCQYTLVTLIEVYLLNKIAQIASFRSKVKDQSLLITYFNTEGYRQNQHNDLKKISFNYVMLAIELVFITSLIKKFRTVENVQIKQSSRFATCMQSLTERGIKRPDKFSFFLPTYVKEHSQLYLNKLKEFGEEGICQLYSQYFLSIIISELQTGKKGPLQIRSLLSFGDAYLTSAMINLCQDQLNSLPEGIENKRKYLGLFHEFVRWGDIQAVLMINTADFITKISINICGVRGDINLNQGENIYPQIPGKKMQKKQLYTDFLRYTQTWAECFPLNEQGVESNVRRIYIFLKEQKKFKFPQNLVLKRYKKQLEDNLKKNEQRNQKLLQIINSLDFDQQSGMKSNVKEGNTKRKQSLLLNKNPVQSPKHQTKAKQFSIKPEQKTMLSKKTITFSYLQDQIEQITKYLQQILTLNTSGKQLEKKIKMYFVKLNEFKVNWGDWLQNLEIQNQDEMSQEDQAKLEDIVMNGDECIEAIGIIFPLMEMFNQSKISAEDMIKRMKQNLEVHQDLTISRSKHLDMTKSIGKSAKKSLSNTIHKSIMNLSAHRLATPAKFQNSMHNKNLMANSLYKSLSKSNHISMAEASSLLRKSKILEKLNRIKPNSQQIGQLIQTRNANFEKSQSKMSSMLGEKGVQKQPFRHAEKQVNEYFQQQKSIALRSQQVIRQQQKSSYPESISSRKLNSKQNSLKGSLKQSKQQNSMQSSRQSRQQELLQSPRDSRDMRSQKNITIISRSNMEQTSNLVQQSKQVVADMNISSHANNIVVEYSDIDENEFQEKAKEKEKEDQLRDKVKIRKLEKLEKVDKSQSNEFDKVFLKSGHQFQRKAEQTASNAKSSNKRLPIKQKEQMGESKRSQVSISDEDAEPVSTFQKKIVSQQVIKNPETNKLQSSNQEGKKIGKPASSTEISSFPTRDKLSNRLTPLNEDYGGKTPRIQYNFDQIQTPKRSQQLQLQKTKKSQSKISISSDRNDDANESMRSSRSSKSIRQKLKSRINQRRNESRQKSQRSLQSQIREMKQVELKSQASQNRSVSKKKFNRQGYQQNEGKLKGKVQSNEEYHMLPMKLKNFEKLQSELDKTKKVSESDEDFKNRIHEVEQERQDAKVMKMNMFQQKPNYLTNNSHRNIEKQKNNLSSESRIRQKGISLSLGKRGSYINSSREKQSAIKKPLIGRQSQPQQNLQARKQYLNERQQSQDNNNLRQEYFTDNMKRSKHSNRSRIKKKLTGRNNGSDSDSSCDDKIFTPNHKPLIQSHYNTKDLEKQRRIGQDEDNNIQFKRYIQEDLKREIICPKSREIQNIIKYGNKKYQIKDIIQTNPNSRKAKSEQKGFSGSFLKDKSKNKQVGELKDKLKALEMESKNMKTKLAVRDQQVKSFKNTSERGFVEFSTPSQSNYFTSSDGFKTSKIGSEKTLNSPPAHQISISQFQGNSGPLKYIKSAPYKQYFQKIKGSTFRKTLLKMKSLIQKQQQIQIGCMSIRKEDYSIQVTIFITPLRFDLADINYTILTDQNLSIDYYPKKLPMIEVKKQQKIHIKMAVKKVPFSIPEIELTYKSKSQYSTNYFRLPIPTLFNKFCQLESVPIESFENKKISSDRMISTPQFKVNTKVIKLQKIKQILPSFTFTKRRDYNLLTCGGMFKQSIFWIIIKLNEKNHGIIEGILQEGQNFKYLQFLLVTLKAIMQVQK